MESISYFKIKEGMLDEHVLAKLNESSTTKNMIGVFLINNNPVKKDDISEGVFVEGIVDYLVVPESFKGKCNLSESNDKLADKIIKSQFIMASLDFNTGINKISNGNVTGIKTYFEMVAKRVKLQGLGSIGNDIAEMLNLVLLDDMLKSSITNNSDGIFVKDEYKVALNNLLTDLRNLPYASVNTLINFRDSF